MSEAPKNPPLGRVVLAAELATALAGLGYVLYRVNAPPPTGTAVQGQLPPPTAIDICNLLKNATGVDVCSLIAKGLLTVDQFVTFLEQNIDTALLDVYGFSLKTLNWLVSLGITDGNSLIKWIETNVPQAVGIGLSDVDNEIKKVVTESFLQPLVSPLIPAAQAVTKDFVNGLYGFDLTVARDANNLANSIKNVWNGFVGTWNQLRGWNVNIFGINIGLGFLPAIPTV